MSDIIEFLTSKEIILVYVVLALACVVCFIVYIVEKNTTKFRQRHNTKELNKLVEKIKEEVPEEENEVIYNEPVLEATSEVIESSDNEVVHVSPVEEIVENSDDNKVEEVKEEEELQYTTIEPDQETAKMELKRITEELMKQEEENNLEVEKDEYVEPEIEEVESDTVEMNAVSDNNIELTSFEAQQENDAIISLDEFTKRGKEIYEANELNQYQDEGNEPISLQDLEKTMDLDMTLGEQPFIISNVVSNEDSSTDTPIIEEVNNSTETTNNTKVEENASTFKNSPIISPIFGIEKDNSLELENTANYEKLDNEIKKTNEFLMTLKELQKNLE